jgi:hypothetical protein
VRRALSPSFEGASGFFQGGPEFQIQRGSGGGALYLAFSIARLLDALIDRRQMNAVSPLHGSEVRLTAVSELAPERALSVLKQVGE